MLANLLYVFALAAVSPLVVYRMVRHGRYRRGLAEKLLGLSALRAKQLRGRSERCLWIHAVSVGEVNLLPRLVRAFEVENRFQLGGEADAAESGPRTIGTYRIGVVAQSHPLVYEI